MRSFLEVDDLTVEELNRVIDLCLAPNPPKVLQGEGAALVFENHRIVRAIRWKWQFISWEDTLYISVVKN